SGVQWLETASGDIAEDLGNDTYAWFISGLSEGEIRDNLSPSGRHHGDYSLSLTLDANSGGNGQCPHSDDGEEVSYYLTAVLMKFEILMDDGSQSESID
ncbi:MAG: hypothetical protein ACPGRV_03195, partial [Candidatus Thalassarchaeaceae archaeon]